MTRVNHCGVAECRAAATSVCLWPLYHCDFDYDEGQEIKALFRKNLPHLTFVEETELSFLLQLIHMQNSHLIQVFGK